MNLKQAAAMAARLAPRKGRIPMMSNVLLAPSEGGVTLTAFSFDRRIFDRRIEIDVAGVELTEPVVVPASMLARLLAWQPDARLRVAGHVLFLEHEYSCLTLVGQPAKNFEAPAPTMDPAETVDVAFSRADFAWCARNTSPDDSRPVLTGVAVYRETGAMAASDGFRLRVVGTSEDENEIASVIGAEHVQFLPDVEHFRANKSYAYFEAPGLRYWAALIQGTFPNFRKLIPAEAEILWRVDIDTLYLRPAVYGPLSLIGKDGASFLRITDAGDGKVAFTARTEEVGEATFKLPADIQGSPQVAINIKYFREMLAGSPAERLTIHGISPSAQLLFTSDNEARREVIMPMFVQWD